ncbi:MAG: bifunctional adenosylcobinamide kinase/adenosylcobinamide-phosphate guanylyltransferase [Pseudomonadota bacterium]
MRIDLPHKYRCGLCIGGARSGKSALAESWLETLDGPLVYLATADPAQSDAPMAARIAAHQTRRTDRWTVYTHPLDLHAGLAQVPDRPVLVDSMTLWYSNMMLAEQDIAQGLNAIIAALPDRTAPVIFVTDEVGQGIVPAHPLGRQFRDEAGQANQALARAADAVVFVVAGLPMILKTPL